MSDFIWNIFLFLTVFSGLMSSFRLLQYTKRDNKKMEDLYSRLHEAARENSKLSIEMQNLKEECAAADRAARDIIL